MTITIGETESHKTTLSDVTEKNSVIGRCAGCGKETNRYSLKYRWHICTECDSQKVLEDISDHVVHPLVIK